MADEIELTADKDLVPITSQLLSNLEKRVTTSAKKRQRDIELKGVQSMKKMLEDMALEGSRLTQGPKKLKDLDWQLRSRILANWNDIPDTSSLKIGAVDLADAVVGHAALMDRPVAYSDIKDIHQSIQNDKNEVSAREAKLLKKKIKLSKAEKNRLENVEASIKEVRKVLDEVLLDFDKSENRRKERKKLQDQAATLRQRLDQEVEDTQENRQKRTKDEKELLKTETQLAKTDPDVQIASALAKLAALLPTHSQEGQVFRSLSEQARVAAMDRSAGLRAQKLADAVGKLKDPGSSTTINLNLAAGVEFGLAAVANVRVLPSYGFTVRISHTDDGFEIRHMNSLALNVSAGGSVGIASMRGSAEAGVASAETSRYKTFEELVIAEGKILTTIAMGQFMGSGRKAAAEIRRDNALQEKTVVDQAKFRRQLVDTGVLDPLGSGGLNSGPLKGHDLAPIERIRVTEDIVRGNVGFNAELGFFEDGDAVMPHASGSASIEYSRTVQQEFKTLSYVDDITDNALTREVELNRSGNHLKRMDESGNPEAPEETVNYLRKLEDRLKAYTQYLDDNDPQTEDYKAAEALADDAREQIKSDLLQLKAEVDLFTQVSTSVSRKDTQASAAGQIQQQLLSGRNIKGSNQEARYIKAVSLQYGLLRNLYNQSVAIRSDNDQDFDVNLGELDDDIRVPKIDMTQSQRRAAFGDEASTNTVSVSTTSLSLSIGGGTAGKGSLTDKKVGDFGSSGGISVGFKHSTKEQLGKVIDRSVKLDIDLGIGAVDRGIASSEKVNEAFSEKKAYNLAAKIFDRNTLNKLGMKFNSKTERDNAVDHFAKAILATGRDTGHLQVNLSQIDGHWHLTTAKSIKTSSLSVGSTGFVNVGAANIILKGNLERVRSKEGRVYYAHGTLSSATDMIRRHGDSPSKLRRFERESGYAKRNISALEKAGDGKGRSENDTGFLDILKELRKNPPGIAVGRTDQWKLSATGGMVLSGFRSVKVANDLMSLLLDLKNDNRSPADIKAADDFIDSYLGFMQRPSLGANPTDDEKKQSKAARKVLEKEFLKVLVTKTHKEDKEATVGANKRFVNRVGVGGADIERDLVRRISRNYKDLESRARKHLRRRGGIGDPPEGVSSIDHLVDRLISKSRPGDDDEKLLKDALSLQHAVKSRKDIDQLKDKGDRTAAMAKLSAQVDRVFTDHKVYMTGLVEGRLHKRDNGHLVIYPVVERDKADVVTRKYYESARKEAAEKNPKLKFSKTLRIADDDSPNKELRPWKPTLSDKARKIYEKKRYSPDEGGPRIKGLFKRRNRPGGDKSISDSMKEVMAAELARNRRLALLIKQKRKKLRAEREAARD